MTAPLGVDPALLAEIEEAARGFDPALLAELEEVARVIPPDIRDEPDGSAWELDGVRGMCFWNRDEEEGCYGRRDIGDTGREPYGGPGAAVWGWGGCHGHYDGRIDPADV